jgi:ABC-type Fe3+ transport system substrate-binding protein
MSGPSRLVIPGLVAILVALMAVPVALAPRGAARGGGERRQLVIVTPHQENIRVEFKRTFETWHRDTFGEDVDVVWSTPGGTSEIRRVLEASYLSDIQKGQEPGGDADLLWGGGSYEFMQLSKPLVAKDPQGNDATTTVLAPLPLPREFLLATYGAERIGDVPLFDAEGKWFGTALSGFGIVSNSDVLARLGVPSPARWEDLTDPRLRGEVALANPAQSGSVTTAFEAILQRKGWTDGWAILRRMAANARSFSASAPKAPTDVSLGDAAAGVCIDFYGRSQAQMVADAERDVGRERDVPRVLYIDPAGETVIDPDPIGLLRGSTEPELARRFVEFTLSREGQALWQFPARDRVESPDGLGPAEHELRRLPVRRELYERDFRRFSDPVDPYAIASAVAKPNPDMRSFLAPIFVAFAIDSRAELADAWKAIVTHPAYPADRHGLVRAADVTDPTLKRMLELFDDFPTVSGPDGTTYPLADTASLGPVKSGWLRGGWKDRGLWPEGAAPVELLRADAIEFFRDRYRRIARLGRGEGEEG